MKKNIVTNEINPVKNIIKDALSEFVKESAQTMLKTAIEKEVQDFVLSYSDQKLDDGNTSIVRNGYLPERAIQTGIGDINIAVPRIRDRSKTGIQFTPSLVPKYMRRSITIDTLLPLLYLKGIPTKDFTESFEPILGHQPKNLSPNVISRLKKDWHDQYLQWQKRDMKEKKYVYIWADGVYLQARMESEKNCILVIIGATPDGKKEVIAIDDGYRESKDSWKDLLLDLKKRGLTYSPSIATGDGAMGFWGALTEVYPGTAHQRCWVHKTANILNKLPKSEQSDAKSMIHDIYMASTEEKAKSSWDKFIKEYSAKYPKAVACISKDQKQLFEFYNFPAEHWVHLRTTNPIESMFSTVKHRTRQSRGCFSKETLIGATFKLSLEASKRWHHLRARKRLAEIINMEKFIDGINEKELPNFNENRAA